jgi:hypothetical protein
MPLTAGKSRKVISANIREMRAAGHSQAQSVAASLRNAGVKRKDPPMKSMKSGHEAGMAGEKGMSPRKAMASGAIKGGNFGAESYDGMNGGGTMHPDHSAGTGMKGAMGEADRATPPGIHHTKNHMPAQAAPRHGPHAPGGHGMDWDREGWV